MATLIEQREQEPTTGTELGNNCYKIRLDITSQGKGKSGGARFITHVRITCNTVYLLSIYDNDKNELENIADNIIKK
ncbi:hypothetical protein [Flavihumibacter profundi]|uniref:hypothetical protein n=1 Tax=Flavihumibacter profundi TaxID=2716883 RepID=UPI001CC7B326|nr:hypothetical protein [Flavihumibacter profundi]MBZ5856404.1 hypothetical protein [Flavihumibacter profundi]